MFSMQRSIITATETLSPLFIKVLTEELPGLPITGNLPERGSTYTIAEDHLDKDLLFAGTEFGVYFTKDGGQKWIQLKGGLPTIAVRDIAIQKRESDLSARQPFGRGYYILDDYSPLRNIKKDDLNKDAFHRSCKRFVDVY
jgi:hypothetical protein